MAGGPRWTGTERWGVEAKAENFPGRLSREQLQKPLQNLLADRFQLRTRRETREMLVYALVKAQSGPKLEPATEASRHHELHRGALNGKSANMDLLARVLATLLDRPVLNQTGIAGEYAIHMEWPAEPGVGESVPGLTPDVPDRKLGSIFTEIQGQLGLRLESRRAPAEIVVVDSAERPDAN